MQGNENLFKANAQLCCGGFDSNGKSKFAYGNKAAVAGFEGNGNAKFAYAEISAVATA